jgi:hypothetical protein
MNILPHATALLLLCLFGYVAAAQTQHGLRPWFTLTKEISVATGIGGFSAAHSLRGYSEHAVTGSPFVNIDAGVYYPIKGRFFAHTGVGLGYAGISTYSDIDHTRNGLFLAVPARTEKFTSSKYLDVTTPVLGGMYLGKGKKIYVAVGGIFSYRAAESMNIKGVNYQQDGSIYVPPVEVVGQVWTGNFPDSPSFPMPWTQSPEPLSPWDLQRPPVSSFDYESELPTSRFQVAATTKVSYALPFKKEKGFSVGLQGLWYLTEYNVGDGHLARYRVQAVLGKGF